MIPASISILTICGIDELPAQGSRSVSHVLSVLDPGRAEIDAFAAYGDHHRTTLRFHDIIDPAAGMVMPAREHVEAILDFGTGLRGWRGEGPNGHLLVHCHMGISRSTAAMLTLMAQTEPDTDEDVLFARLREIRSQAWPNSVMVGMADDMLGREGRLVAALRRHYGHQAKARPEFAEWIRTIGRAREVEMAA